MQLEDLQVAQWVPRSSPVKFCLSAPSFRARTGPACHRLPSIVLQTLLATGAAAADGVTPLPEPSTLLDHSSLASRAYGLIATNNLPLARTSPHLCVASSRQNARLH